jgi:inosine-uridine nucleoside N-ribohydrolase
MWSLQQGVWSLQVEAAPSAPSRTSWKPQGAAGEEQGAAEVSADPRYRVATPSRPVPVIIDTDAGIDDAVALALAARSPELEMVAVTTTYGNAPLEATTRNTRELLRLVGRERVPIYPGAAKPLTRPLVTAPETHGMSGVGFAPVSSPSSADGTSNPRSLAEVLYTVSKPVTLITLGPLTNLALALQRDPEVVTNKVERHLGMFGNIAERGNTNRWADFNAWSDPEAVQLVLEAGLGTEMVGLDVTRRMALRSAEVDRLAAADEALIRWLERALAFYVQFHRSQERFDGCVVNDVLPVGEVLNPGLLEWREISLRVSLDDGEHRGHTREHSEGTPTRVAVGVDIPQMRSLLRRVFGDWLDA